LDIDRLAASILSSYTADGLSVAVTGDMETG